MQAPSLAALSHAFSAERLNAYRLPTDADDLDMVARYLWSLALAAALQPALHTLEVTFRNALYAGSAKVLANRKLRYADIPCWLDATPSLLMPRERQTVEDAKERLRKLRHRRYMTSGRLISKLSFGFWTGLCNSPYEQARGSGPGIWPDLLKHAFLFAPREHRNRPAILHRFDEIRNLRNRVSHHEPVWDWDLPAWHAKILETLAWMNQSAEGAVRRESALETLYRAGAASFRPRAEALLAKRSIEPAETKPVSPAAVLLGPGVEIVQSSPR